MVIEIKEDKLFERFSWWWVVQSLRRFWDSIFLFWAQHKVSHLLNWLPLFYCRLGTIGPLKLSCYVNSFAVPLLCWYSKDVHSEITVYWSNVLYNLRCPLLFDSKGTTADNSAISLRYPFHYFLSIETGEV